MVSFSFPLWATETGPINTYPSAKKADNCGPRRGRHLPYHTTLAPRFGPPARFTCPSAVRAHLEPDQYPFFAKPASIGLTLGGELLADLNFVNDFAAGPVDMECDGWFLLRKVTQTESPAPKRHFFVEGEMDTEDDIIHLDRDLGEALEVGPTGTPKASPEDWLVSPCVRFQWPKKVFV